MRRILLLTIGVLALAIAAPSAASAHGRHHRHHHHAKAHHARVKHFGATANVNDPSTPDAGTVDAFANGTLTIRLNDGTTVSGAVDDSTVVNCMGAQPTAAASSHDEGDDDQGDNAGDDQQGDQPGGDDQGDQGDDSGDHGQAACDTTDLVAGATVHVAILKLGGDGPTFKLVLLRS
ncbi:MAG: hypothetical protein ACTHOE_04325 [Conexibacter sp.]